MIHQFQIIVARLTFSMNSFILSTIENSNTLSDLRQSMEAHPELINLIDFSTDEGHKELLNLQKDKGCGPDCVPTY